MALLYEYLRSLPPFCSLSLPESDEVEFFIVKDRERFAWWQWMGERHRISISAFGVGHSATLLAVLAHEMAHMAVFDAGLDTGGNENTHNAAFRQFAAQACKVHGFDPRAFY